MPRPRNDSPKSLLSEAHSTIAALLRDEKTPPEVKARLSLKVVDWCREDARSEGLKIELTAAREAELKAQGVAEHVAGLTQAVNEAIAESEQKRPTYRPPTYPDFDSAL